MTAVAMSSAGFLVYLLEDARIDSSLNQQIKQESDELRALESGDDPDTSAPFASVGRLLELYLQRNVTDDDEMLVRYLDGEERGYSANQFGAGILDQPVYQSAVERQLDDGGTEVIQSPT